MGYLDELKMQAEQQQVLHRAAIKRTEQLEAIYRERILPKLERIYSYLFEVCTHLNTLEMDISVNYELDELGKLEGLQQGNYSVQADSSDQLKEVVLSLDCSAEGDLDITVESKIKVEKWTQFLQQHHLKYHTKLHVDERKAVTGAQFIINRFVPITFKFVADIENSSINLSIYNFNSLGDLQIQFSPESITEEALDKLGKYLARKNNSFFDLEISETDRRRLRAKVMYEQQQRDMELLASDNKLHEAVLTPKKKGFLGMFKGK